jgi:hypothetical protein
VNLKAHVCKKEKAKRVKVELVPPPNKKTLADCEKNIRRVYETIGGKTRAFQEDVVYDCVEMGLYFLKAKDAIGHGHFEDFVRSATSAPGTTLTDVFCPSDKNETVSFLPPVQLRTAQNYMNAARNAGLTVASTSADVEKLRATEALHGKRPGDLYKLKDKEEEEEDESGGTKWNLMRDAAVNLREHCDTVVELKPQMNKKVFSTVCARLQRTLEELTGNPWDMIAKEFAEHARAKFKEHGDVYEIGS